MDRINRIIRKKILLKKSVAPCPYLAGNETFSAESKKQTPTSLSCKSCTSMLKSLFSSQSPSDVGDMAEAGVRFRVGAPDGQAQVVGFH